MSAPERFVASAVSTLGVVAGLSVVGVLGLASLALLQLVGGGGDDV